MLHEISKITAIVFVIMVTAVVNVVCLYKKNITRFITLELVSVNENGREDDGQLSTAANNAKPVGDVRPSERPSS